MLSLPPLPLVTLQRVCDGRAPGRSNEISQRESLVLINMSVVSVLFGLLQVCFVLFCILKILLRQDWAVSLSRLSPLGKVHAQGLAAQPAQAAVWGWISSLSCSLPLLPACPSQICCVFCGSVSLPPCCDDALDGISG